MRRHAGSCLLALALGACAGRPLHPTAPAPGATADSIEQLAAAVAADAARSDHEANARAREDLADDALSHADACVTKAPQSAACLYERAIALGLQARAHATRALEFLKTMLELLARADAADPTYDEAGPSRVRALVLIRAPGWPLGPGDVEAGLEAARRAMALRPHYVPNLLALAEAQMKAGDAAGARSTYTRARDLAEALPAGEGRSDWVRQAEQGLQQR